MGERVLVLFLAQPNGVFRGLIQNNPSWSFKLVRLLDSWKPGIHNALAHQDSWWCEVVEDTEPDNPRSGTMYVIPVEPHVRYFSCQTGSRVIVQEDDLHRLRANVGASDLLVEVLSTLEIPKRRGTHLIEKELDRVVGVSTCVPVPPVSIDDPTLFAVRIGRQNPTHVTRDAEGVPCSSVVVCVEFLFPELYQLKTLYIGRRTHREPTSLALLRGSMEKRIEALEFWSSHALVYDPEVMAEPYTSTWRQVFEEAGRPLPDLDFSDAFASY